VEQRPVIGIATQTLEAIPGKLPLSWVMGQCYVRVLTTAGALPWIIPLMADDGETLRGIYEAVDGIFLTGGVDVHPGQYGEEAGARCGQTDPERDRTELALIHWALRDRKPILGVCRGIQVINVAAGGTLYQDMATQYPNGIKHDFFPPAAGYTRASLVHTARIAPNSRLAQILRAKQISVNSMHHQGIKALAGGLTASAHAPDGSIEGIEGVNHPFLIGVQWHPEELASTQPRMRRLFSSFVEAALAYRQQGHGGSVCVSDSLKSPSDP
jgi:putative glutamine amidotransferase